MTNTVEDIVDRYAGNSIATVWPYNFKADADSEIVVKLIDTVNDTITVVADTMYDVTRNSNNVGGTVTYPLAGSPLTSDFEIFITRDVDMIQPDTLLNQGGMFPVTIEDALDNLSKQIQQLRRDAQNGVYIRGWSTGGDSIELPKPTYPKVIGWGPAGELENKDISVGAFITYPPATIIDLEYFLRTMAPRDALYAAHQALFNEPSAVPMMLECHGIEVQLDSPFILRRTDLNFGASPQSAEKIVSNMSLTRTTGAYVWQTRDYLYSIAGEAGFADLRFFTLLNPRIDMAADDLVGIHLSGYYHASVVNVRIRGLEGTAIGILSSKYDIDTGVGNPGAVTDNANHGLAIIQPDIRGTFADTDATIGIYLEDGDAVVKGGWMSWLAEGIVTKRGGLNTEGVHFSMSDRTNMTVAIRCDAARNCSFVNDELDGCCYLFDNPTDNMWTEGVSFANWDTLSIRGGKFSGSKAPGGDTAGFGHINFRTITAANNITGLWMDSDWSGTNIETAMFLASGAGTWDGPNFNDIVYNTPHSVNNIPGTTFPASTKLRLARLGNAASPIGLKMDVATGALELVAPAQAGDTPYVKAIGKAITFGRYAAGVQTDRWEIHSNGHLRPITNNTIDIGEAAQQVHDLFMAGALTLGAGGSINLDSGTATAAGGAATLNKMAGVITTEDLTTAAGSNYVLTLTNSVVGPNDIVMVSVDEGTNTAGLPAVAKVNPASTELIVTIRNIHASAAFNGTLRINFVVFKP